MNIPLATTRTTTRTVACFVTTTALGLALATQVFAAFPVRMAAADCPAPGDRQSADSHLQNIVAGYTRATLDRGGWHNTHVATTGYAAGEPLLAADVGTGVTTQGAGHQPQPARIAAH
ncbi:MAG: hypothetical protein RLZZ584_2343 [Pseudomonadota bacterium]|jgi:hypothetical protein